MELFTVRIERTSKKGAVDVKYIGSAVKKFPRFRFTKDISRVPFSLIFNTREKAELKAKEIMDVFSSTYKESLEYYVNQERINKKHSYHPIYKHHYRYKQNYDGSENITYSSINAHKVLSESVVVVVPYEITGKFNKDRISKTEWVSSGSPNKFCNICGCNILTNSYLEIGGAYKLCAVCIKNASVVAENEIAIASEHWGFDILHENEVQRFVGRL